MECPLAEYSYGVALEFAVLLLILCYVASFGLHDVERLLARGGRAKTSSPEIGAAGSELGRAIRNVDHGNGSISLDAIHLTAGTELSDAPARELSGSVRAGE